MNRDVLKEEIESLRKAETKIRAVRQKKESQLRTIIHKEILHNHGVTGDHQGDQHARHAEA